MSNGRRLFCRTLARVALAAGVSARAQAPARLPRIGVLFIGSPPPANSPPVPFQTELARVGLIEGLTVVMDVRFAHGDPSRLDAMAAELVASQPDLILTASGAVGARAAKKATTTIPIVFSGVGDPVGAGLVASLAKPGGNLTGGAIPPDLELKRVQILLQVIGPSASIFMLTAPMSEMRKAAMRQSLSATGMNAGASLHFRELTRLEDLAPAFEYIARQPGAGVAVGLTPFTSIHNPEIAAAALKYRLATIAHGLDAADAGMLMSYSFDALELSRAVAKLVSRILKGEKPADLPVEQVTKFDFVVNMKTARTLGLRIPSALLLTASRVVT
jgi:putative ABC transport system substrate-binding protein